MPKIQVIIKDFAKIWYLEFLIQFHWIYLIQALLLKTKKLKVKSAYFWDFLAKNENSASPCWLNHFLNWPRGGYFTWFSHIPRLSRPVCGGQCSGGQWWPGGQWLLHTRTVSLLEMKTFPELNYIGSCWSLSQYLI